MKRSLARSGPYVSIAEVGGTTFTDLTVSNGTKYFYVVSAINAAGEGKDSNKVRAFVAPVPAAPSDVSASTGTLSGTIEICRGRSRNGPRGTAFEGAARAVGLSRVFGR